MKGKTIALWGLSFKPQTDDMREAPSREVITELTKRGATICGFDPVAMTEAKRVMGDNPKLTFADDMTSALLDADALLIATEWNSFREPDWETLKQTLKNPVVFDGRNIYSPDVVREQGFTYYSIGRPVID